MIEPTPPSRFRPVKILAYLVLGVTASAGALILLKAAAREPINPAAAAPPAPPVNVEEARKALADLRQRVAKASTVTDDLIAEIHAAGNRWNRTWAAAFPSDQESPFDRLASMIVMHRAEAAAQTFGQLQAEVELETRARRYGRAREALARFKPDPTLEELYRLMVTETLATFDADLARVEEHGSALVEAGRYAEASRWFAAQAGRFAGTDRHGRLAGRPETLAEISRADEARRRRDEADVMARADEAIRKIMAPPAPSVSTPAPAPGTPAAPPLGPFHARLAERVNQGHLAKKKYSFGAGISGPPTAAGPEGLTVGGAKIAWSGVSPEILFSLVMDSFHMEDWVLAAEYAYATGSPTHGDQFLWRYLGGGDRKQRQAKIDEILARFRGLRSVPEGGYLYDPKIGWEDATQRTNRTAVDDARRHLKAMVSADDGKRRDEIFEKLKSLYLKPGLAEDPRDRIRVAVVEGLNDLRKELIADLARKAKGTAQLGQLRALKLELKRRREEAIKVIYDPKIYLPEDDPRWSQGDKINGQEKVDELVAAVREVWEQPARLILSNSRVIERDLEEIRAIHERYLPPFGVEGDAEKDLAAFEELRNNLNEQLSVKSYSLNGGDRQDYEWNRRVDRYNDALRETGITRDEIEHARTLNDYREMMGRRRVFLDARLCRATKKHSAVCDKAGRIWHVGSDGDPQSRARAEGFSAGVSENVAIGYSSPADIWTRGWYRASDHHRNGLNDSWNTMGYGYVGRVGTQNFSTIGPPRGF